MFDYRPYNMAALSTSARWIIVLSVTLATITVLLFVPPIPQNQAYHQFADDRSIWGIANFWNVVSNMPFLIVGIAGLILLRKQWKQGLFSGWRELVPYGALVTGIFLTALGSAYYHYHPDDSSLVWDRIPMTIIFMSFVAIVLLVRVNHRIGYRLFWVLLLVGIGSVIYWHLTSLNGDGDLRFYAWVQFFSPVFVALILYLFPGSFPPIRDVVWIVMLYSLAKVCEYFDNGIYQATHTISGHALKHLVAAISLGWVLFMLSKRKRQVSPAIRS